MGFFFGTTMRESKSINMKTLSPNLVKCFDLYRKMFDCEEHSGIDMNRNDSSFLFNYFA